LVPSQLSFQFLALNQLKWRQRKVLEGKLRIKNSERLAFTQTRKSVKEIFWFLRSPTGPIKQLKNFHNEFLRKQFFFGSKFKFLLG